MGPQPAIRFLDRERCLELLGDAVVGRVAVLVNGVPQVVPVNYVVVDGDVVFRSGAGTKLAAAMAEQPVSFEVDRVDEERLTGWSVLLSGRASVVSEPEVLRRVDEAALVTWAPGPKDDVVRISAETISGREIERS
jgi:uncharacterized protein